MDFYRISTVESKKGNIIYPELEYGPSTDLMIRGHDFYAIWDEQNNRWSQNGNDMIDLIDSDLRQRAAEIEKETGDKVKIQLCRNFNSQVWHNIRKYFANSFDTYHQLDEDLTFANTETTKKDYRSKRLPYALVAGDYSGYDELMDTLYDPDERDKLEWAIGAIVAGKAKHLQKFVVLYGEAGTGKSTVLDIIQQLFPGYYVTFDAKALGSANRQFATEVFRSDPLVAIQHDGDLSRIESNETLNSVVSHEEMTMHVKYHSDYTARVNAFLFMGTNKPVKITDAKSGIIRRLIDVSPSGRKLPYRKYQEIMRHKIPFELGAIAWHCKEVFEELGENYYDKYKPISMMFDTDPFYNFIEANYFDFEKEDYVTLNRAWALYKEYCEDAAVQYKLTRHVFRSELRNYFREFKETWRDDEGRQLRSVFIGFLKERFEAGRPKDDPEKSKKSRRKKNEARENLDSSECAIVDRSNNVHSESSDGIDSSIFDQLALNRTSGELDIELAECPAQYANDKETPTVKWENCRTKLKDLDPTKLHYVRPPENIICIDFDLKDENGQKSQEKNLEAASKWPATYAEFSKGGAGIHLHYFFDGKVDELSALYAPGIEIKVFTGKSSLRRKLSYCNDLPIAHINSGLPIKEVKRVVNFTRIASEKALRDLINRNLRKEIHPATKPSVDFIYRILEDAYNGGLIYDIRDMRNKILAFANNSTNNSAYCVRLVGKMKFCSEEGEQSPPDQEAPIVFYDCESFMNVFIVCWKQMDEEDGLEHKVVRMINPKPLDIEQLMKFRLIGHNSKFYDDHMIYACYLGETPYQLYQRSQRLISKENKRNGYIREAFSVGYADTLDFASAMNKKGLKKWEIELGIHHQENQYPWDEPLPEEYWDQVASYCENDVKACEAVFKHIYSDFVAREILADIAGLPINTSTNNLTTAIIFGKEKRPKLVYTDFKTGEQWLGDDPIGVDELNKFPEYEMIEETNAKGQTMIRNYYRGVELGRGGYIYSEPGVYTDVALLDSASHHVVSAIMLNYMGEYTKNFKALLDARLYIKHKDYESASKLFDGKLAKYLTDPGNAKKLSNALKTALVSVYGLTSAKFETALFNKRNKNNIVALRGAIFLKMLKDEVDKQGFHVISCRTDSIKIPNATPEIIKFVQEFARKWGYEFEHEATYKKMCLINDTDYAAQYMLKEECLARYRYCPEKNEDRGGKWDSTGVQFSRPFVFKSLFSHEQITFSDMCETKEVQSAMYLDLNEGLPDVSVYENELAEREKADTVKSKKLNPIFSHLTNEQLIELSAPGHNYKFVGKIGSFIPMKNGCGSGELLAYRNGKYSAVTGTKGYRWLEAEFVKAAGLEDYIDLNYHRGLVDDMLSAISKYCDPEWFVSDDPMPQSDYPQDDPNNVPWLMRCGDPTKTVCEDCSDRDHCPYYQAELQEQAEFSNFQRR